MNRKRQAAISLSAAMLAGVLVYGVYGMQLKQIKQQETVKVVVPRHFVPAGATLTLADLDVTSLPLSMINNDMMTDPEEAIGMEAGAPLGAGEPLLRWKLDRYRLLPSLGEATFQIPREYVKSVSGGIRAGDRVVVYLSDAESPSRRLFAHSIVVAGVKSAANQEIDNPKNPNLLSMASGDKERMYASRREANGSIDTIHLNLTEEQWLSIDTACKNGQGQLVIAFAANAIDALAVQGVER